jgi:CMP-N-acetylneuraminate monooxygenase
LNLNNTPEIVHCENIQVRLNGCFFYVENGELFIGKKTKPNLEIDMPIEILQQIIVDNVSWDEAHIGYWCKMKRIGEYNQNFWRLLQSPYYMKRGKKIDCEIMNINVNYLLKKYPETDTILRRYGLYCSSCSSAFKENISQAIEYHGLSKHDSKKLLKELNFILNKERILKIESVI